MVIRPGFEPVVKELGLDSMAGARAYEGELVKNHRGRRDIFRIRTRGPDGRELVLYLKRNWRPYKKDGLASVLRRGKAWSLSRQEWENAATLTQAGLRTARMIAYGEEMTPGWERFSFLLTAAADAPQTLDEFLRACHDPDLRRRVFAALAGEVRRLHAAGLATPDLFCRHIFVDPSASPPTFCLIDMARLDHQPPLSDALRARDLAALNVTAPLRFVSARERLRFLRLYRGGKDRAFARRVICRVNYLLRRRGKFADYLAGAPAAG